MQRYFSDEVKPVNEYLLPSEIYKHAIVVLRTRVGEHLEIVDTQQVIHVMEVTKIENKQAYVKEVRQYQAQVELPLDVTIACAISKGDKAEWIVQKATELGANRFIFYNGDYSVAKWDIKKVNKKLERLTKIAQGAAQQSHRVKVPKVTFAQTLTEIANLPVDCRLVAYEQEAKDGEKSRFKTALHQLKKPASLLAFFGPEGGISEKEISLLKEYNFIPAALGPRIMRAETAPLYLLSALSFMFELE